MGRGYGPIETETEIEIETETEINRNRNKDINMHRIFKAPLPKKITHCPSFLIFINTHDIEPSRKIASYSYYVRDGMK